jgi:hypothetical protein
MRTSNIMAWLAARLQITEAPFNSTAAYADEKSLYHSLTASTTCPDVKEGNVTISRHLNGPDRDG